MSKEDWVSTPKSYPTPAAMVAQFYKTAGFDPDPVTSLKLICEEYVEWVCEDQRSTGELKELADMVYVIYGYAQSLGYDLDEALYRVHSNNLGRMYQPDGTIKRREDGKVIKNPDYPKVSLGDLI